VTDCKENAAHSITVSLIETVTLQTAVVTVCTTCFNIAGKEDCILPTQCIYVNAEVCEPRLYCGLRQWSRTQHTAIYRAMGVTVPEGQDPDGPGMCAGYLSDITERTPVAVLVPLAGRFVAHEVLL
jgi:hypothetical protein